MHGRSASVTDRMSLRIQVARALGDAVPPGVLVAQVRHERFVLVLPTLIPYEAVRPAIDRALRHVSVVDSVVVGTTPLPRTRAELASLVGRWWHQRPLDHP